MSEPASTPPTDDPASAPDATPDDPAAQPKVTDWEAEARKWEKRSKENYAKVKDAEPRLAEYEQWRQQRQTEAERQAEEVQRWQTDSQRWRDVALSSRIQSLAAEFADPSDAVAALGQADKYLTAGGEIDDDAIGKDLAALLERKPHWRRTDDASPAPRAPAPNPYQGSGGGTPAADPATEFASILRQGLARS